MCVVQPVCLEFSYIVVYVMLFIYAWQIQVIILNIDHISMSNPQFQM